MTSYLMLTKVFDGKSKFRSMIIFERVNKFWLLGKVLSPYIVVTDGT